MNLIIDATTTQDQLKHHGIGQYVKNLLLNLHKYNQSFKDIYLLMFEGKSTIDDFLEEENNTYKIQRIGKPRLDNYLNHYWYSTQIKPGIKKILSKQNKDFIYFAPYFKRGIPTNILPTVISIHDFAQPHFNNYSDKSGAINLAKKALYWDMMNKTKEAEAIITISEFTKNDYLKAYPDYSPDDIYKTYLGIELTGEIKKNKVSKYLPEDWKKKGYVLYMGGTPAPNKNSSAVIKGFNKFLQTQEDKENSPYLVVAGSSFTEERSILADKIHELVTQLDLDSRVIFTGFYEDEDERSLMEFAKIFIHLSLYEGFGLAVAKAMRAKLPVIAHRGTSYLEVVGDSGILIDSSSDEGIEQVGKKLKKLWENNSLREQLGEKAYKKSLEFDWNKTAEKTLNILQKKAKQLFI